MINAKLTRQIYRSTGIIGVLIINEIKYYIGEHAFEQPDGTFLPTVPKGYYKLTLHDSPHFKRKLWMLNDVPGHTEVLVHNGSYPQIDSHACLLIGKEFNEDKMLILQSRIALDELMTLTEHVNEWNLTVE